MRQSTRSAGHGHIVIESGVSRPDATAIVKHKGLGHPDTLADHLTERLSWAYSERAREIAGGCLRLCGCSQEQIDAARVRAEELREAEGVRHGDR